MKTKTYWLVFAGFFLLAFIPVMLWGSTTLTNLEHKLIDESATKITTLTKHEFGEYGLLVMGKDQSGNGEMYALVRIPGIDRYWVTEMRHYTVEQTNTFAVRDLSNWVTLQLDHENILADKITTGFGYLVNIFLRGLAVAGIASIGALIIDTRIRRRKKHSDTQAA